MARSDGVISVDAFTEGGIFMGIAMEFQGIIIGDCEGNCNQMLAKTLSSVYTKNIWQSAGMCIAIKKQASRTPSMIASLSQGLRPSRLHTA